MHACPLLGTEETKSEVFNGVLITRMDREASIRKILYRNQSNYINVS